MADILYLVERLEQVLAQGWRVPFTTNAVIDEDALIDVIEQMHIAIPNEIRQAQQIVQQKERILAQAREEGERIVAQSKERADQIVDQTEIVERAQERAQYIISQAQKEGEEIRAGSDDYAAEVLHRIRDELLVHLRQIDNGLEQLTAVEQAPSQQIELEELEELEDEELGEDIASSELDFEERRTLP
ncbi:MAG: hypothetical protein M3220_21960 [Chloroflexota bacterium]|nr:hypothetical protein [Chloroflexota bacterium]